MQERTSPDSLKDYVHGKLLLQGGGIAWSSITVQLLSHRPSESRLLVPAVAEPLLVWIVGDRSGLLDGQYQGALRSDG